jgi:hypothetical protein
MKSLNRRGPQSPHQAHAAWQSVRQVTADATDDREAVFGPPATPLRPML